jgi:hypothetical protein
VIPVFLGLVAALFFTLFAQEGEETAKPEYVGVQKCKMCHKKVHEAWKATTHATAFETLGDTSATDESCLPCHATGYGSPGGYVDAESTPNFMGVTCESCHGAGSLYWKLPIMKDHEKAVANGLVEQDSSVCISCHNEKSPTFKGFDYEKAKETGIHNTEEDK